MARVPWNRKLPPEDVLREHVEAGMSDKQIGERYGTTDEAVRIARKEATPPIERGTNRTNHSRYIPWRVRADHVSDVIARRLRAYSKKQQGKPLTPTEGRRLEQWVAFMEGDNKHGLKLAVHYDRNDPDGFWLEPWQDGDRDFVSPPR